MLSCSRDLAEILFKPAVGMSWCMVPEFSASKADGTMGIITADMRRVVEEQRLGFVATVCPDGTPNLSPKATTAVWDEDHLIFADICSPTTIANLRHNPGIEVNVVDTVIRKGYRFKGTATIFDSGPRFDELIAFYTMRGSTTPKDHIVLVKVERAAPLVSPAYDQGQTEVQLTAQWRRYWERLWDRRLGRS